MFTKVALDYSVVLHVIVVELLPSWLQGSSSTMQNHSSVLISKIPINKVMNLGEHWMSISTT